MGIAMMGPGRTLSVRAVILAAMAALLTAGCGDPTPAVEQAGQPDSEQAIQLSTGIVQRLGVRTAPAEYGTLSMQLSVAGIVDYHANTIEDTYAPTTGWLEKVAVRTVGQPLRSGDLLFELYSPSLATVDEQYLNAITQGIAPPLNPYSGGLRQIGLTEEMIIDLRAKRRAPGRIPFRATANGVVAELDFKPGIIVQQGDWLLRIAALDPIAVTVVLPESQAAALRENSMISVTAAAYPNQRFSGRIDLVYPEVDATTRAVRARATVANPDGLLKPSMFVTATVDGEQLSTVHVPREAVIRGGSSDRVIVALGDGRFAPRSVTVGKEVGDRLSVVDGLQAGELVVTSGVFLLDSETNLDSGMQRMQQSRSPGHENTAPASGHHH
jgi:membrane fusion protein, copper/silver efflux system